MLEVDGSLRRIFAAAAAFFAAGAAFFAGGMTITYLGSFAVAQPARVDSIRATRPPNNHRQMPQDYPGEHCVQLCEALRGW